MNDIFSKSGCISDLYFEYYNSKFQFSDFKNIIIQDSSWTSKKNFILSSKNGKYYSQSKSGLYVAYCHLINLYQDLDTCLQRIKDNYHDSMFIRFLLKIGMFISVERWELVCRNWYRGFSMALRRYFNACHNKYDPTSGVSYVAFFDTHFSNYLYYAITRADQDWNTPRQEIDYKSSEIIRLSQVNYKNIPWEDMSYSIDNYDFE